MQLTHIIAATDESDAGRGAVRVACDLARRASARATILRVLPLETTRHLVGSASGAAIRNGGRDETALTHLRRWLQADVLSPADAQEVELATAAGIPGIEICRFAERAEADLLVLGRKPHSRMMRLLLGDTADAVARRSGVPCLFIPPGSRSMRRLLVALDGSDRGMNVLEQAGDFALDAGADLQAITVERTPDNEPLQLVSSLPVARSVSLEARVRMLLLRKGLPDVPLAIRRGDILERVIAEAQESAADVLVVGYHRGGAPAVMEAGSTARRLVHAAPCAVLTIPL
jgi:nucleotide-binding universal stress UspA family protein